MKTVFTLLLLVFFLSPDFLAAGPELESKGNQRKGNRDQISCRTAELSNETRHYMKNPDSKTYRVYKIKAYVSPDAHFDISVGQTCGVGSHRFKVLSTAGSTIVLKPAYSNYIDLHPNQEIYLGLSSLYPIWPFTFGLVFDWRYYEIEGPTRFPKSATWTMGEDRIGSCQYSWSFRRLPSGSWGELGNEPTQSLTYFISTLLLKVNHNCPGDVGTRYKTVYVTPNGNNKLASSRGLKMQNVHFNIDKILPIVSNYPNPFNPTTKIEFELFNEQEIDLSVFDLTGRKVETLMSGTLGVGQHAATFDATGLPNGTYLYILTHEAGRVVNRMTLLK